MLTHGRPLLAALALLYFAAAAHGQAAGSVTAVRVYRGQALVTRTVPFEAVAGPQTVIVGNLPETIDPASMYATGGVGITVRTVNFRSTALDAAPGPEVAALDEQIATVQTELARIQSELDVVSRQEQYLDKLETFTAPTMQADLQRGVLNSQALVELTRFQFEQRHTVATTRLQLTGDKEKAEKRLQQLQSDRAKLAGTSQLQREAVVHLEAAAAGAGQFELNYMVGGVAWVPAYIARLADDRAKVELEYHAILTQSTGEDWPAVDLTLSTSHPSMVADPPVLSPLYIGIAPAGQAQQANEPAADAEAYNLRRQELQEQIRARPSATRERAARAGDR
ncbi:MAG: mucoidy inhibitor MuiA family protein, partial [Rubrivivax sp.]|nr:mucoidy inhibitor MuiA family protein [Rubrivivax sp.]